MIDPHIKLPIALENRLQGQLGDEFEQFQAALDAPPPISIRLNPGKPTDHYSNAADIPWADHGKYLESRPRFTDDPLFHAGTYYVQEASSMFLAHVVRSVADLDHS